MSDRHDLSHQVHLVREALQSEKRRLGFLVGAGCPLGIYDAAGEKSLKHIPDVAGLTEMIETALAVDADTKALWTKLHDACKSKETPTPNVEHVLTQIRTICAVKGNSSVDGMPTAALRKLDAEICDLVAKIVGKSLPSHITAYHRFAAWIGRIDRVNPVEVFTPNYDLLLEESFEQYTVPYFDGFVGAREPFFDLVAMEQDEMPSRWARLWKLHGSINWIKRSNESVYRAHPVEKGKQLLIYPSHLKYEQSRRMPYLAMIDRLRAFFRDTNSVLVTCGYSFVDDHLNEVLIDGLRGNRSAHCFALMYTSIKDCDVAVGHARKHSNLTVLALDAAVVGTRQGAYESIDRSMITSGAGLDVEPDPAGSPKTASGPARCRLGDFHHFALFLETQFGVRPSEQAPKALS